MAIYGDGGDVQTFFIDKVDIEYIHQEGIINIVRFNVKNKKRKKVKSPIYINTKFYVIP